MKPAIKMMADYDCWPIWRHDGAIGNVAPSELGLTEGLAGSLESWAVMYDSHLDVSDPASTAWTPEEEKRFDIEGRRLCLMIAEEVGARYRVFYGRDCIPVEELFPDEKKG